jgi:hypothetical protein
MRIICTGIDRPARTARLSYRGRARVNPATAADDTKPARKGTTQLVASTVADALMAAFDKDLST